MRKLAVLVPTYKPGNYISDCFEALERQTLKKANFCVYVCLNGPRDPYQKSTQDALTSYTFHYRFIYVEHGGVSNARNKLIDLSEEEFLVFMDDDDIVSCNYLEGLLSVSTRKDIGISNVRRFRSDIFDSEPNYLGLSFGILNDYTTSKFRSRKFFSSVCGKCIHRKIISNHRFDPEVSKGEDSLFMAKLSPNVGRMRKAGLDACYYVRIRDDSVTRRRVNLKKDLRNLNYVWRQYFALLFFVEYDRLFIFSRLVATAIHYLRLFRRSLFRA